MLNNSDESKRPPRVKLGGLWKHKTKDGLEFFSGDLGNFTQIQIWPNKKREGKKDPDVMIFISQKVKKDSSFPDNKPIGNTDFEDLGDVPF